MTPLTYTKAQLQAALHTPSHAGFLKRLELLEAAGFPKRLPYKNGQLALWSKPAVDHWLQHWGSTQTTPPTADSIIALRNHHEERHVRN